MSNITVIEHQTFHDIAMQEDGTAMSALDWSIANHRSVTDELIPGTVLINPNSKYKDLEVLNYFKVNRKSIATGVIKLESKINYAFPTSY